MKRSISGRAWPRYARAAIASCVLVGAWLPGVSPLRASAVFEVSTNLDGVDDAPGDGACWNAGLSACSLRAAVMEANALAGDDTIVVPSATYVLTEPGGDDTAVGGDLDIGSNITITPASQESIVVDGNGRDAVVEVLPGANAQLSNLTITNGTFAGIRNSGTLALVNCSIKSNRNGAQGGGIYNATGATLFLTNTAVIQNTSLFIGGGIVNEGRLNLVRSVVEGNTALTSMGLGGSGGGIANYGTLEAYASTIKGNRAEIGGGGISNSGTLSATESYVVDNRSTATGSTGGGWHNTVSGGQAVNLTSVTVAGNAATIAVGGIYNAAGAITLRNSIVAGSTGGENCAGTLTSSGTNLDSANSCAFASAGDRANTDPRLGPLADNGSSQPGQTHALLVGSPALDTGAAGCPTADQRGVPRPQDGNGDGTAVCDIGAFELQPAVASPAPSASPAPPSPGPTPPAPPGASRRYYVPSIAR